jgi:hypothetical protein
MTSTSLERPLRILWVSFRRREKSEIDAAWRQNRLNVLEMLVKMTRLLLPFTNGVDMDALEYGVLLAKNHRATLVPLALLAMPEKRRSKGIRLEQVQQAKDFLEAVRYKAERHAVSIERFEVVTTDVVQSIAVLTHQADCNGIVLVVRGQDGVLLQADEIERLMEQLACTYYLIHLAARRKAGIFLLFEELSSRLFNRWEPERRGFLASGNVQEQQADRICDVSIHSADSGLERTITSSTRSRKAPLS